MDSWHCSPVYDALLMQELEAGYDFGAIESRTILRKASALLYMKHEISAIQILHDKEQVTLREIE